MNKVEILKTFIKDNGLVWKPGNRNTPSVIISGFALSIDASLGDVIVAVNAVKELDFYSEKELERVFEYAEKCNYGNNWIEKYSKQYKVDEKLLAEI